MGVTANKEADFITLTNARAVALDESTHASHPPAYTTGAIQSNNKFNCHNARAPRRAAWQKQLRATVIQSTRTSAQTQYLLRASRPTLPDNTLCMRVVSSASAPAASLELSHAASLHRRPHAAHTNNRCPINFPCSVTCFTRMPSLAYCCYWKSSAHSTQRHFVFRRWTVLDSACVCSRQVSSQPIQWVSFRLIFHIFQLSTMYRPIGRYHKSMKWCQKCNCFHPRQNLALYQHNDRVWWRFSCWFRSPITEKNRNSFLHIAATVRIFNGWYLTPLSEMCFADEAQCGTTTTSRMS